jgi:hypothetical protein
MNTEKKIKTKVHHIMVAVLRNGNYFYGSGFDF